MRREKKIGVSIAKFGPVPQGLENENNVMLMSRFREILVRKFFYCTIYPSFFLPRLDIIANVYLIPSSMRYNVEFSYYFKY